MRILLTLVFLLISTVSYAQIPADIKDEAIKSIALNRGVTVESLYDAIDQGELDNEIRSEYEAVKFEIEEAWRLNVVHMEVTDDLILQRFRALNGSFN